MAPAFSPAAMDADSCTFRTRPPRKAAPRADSSGMTLLDPRLPPSRALVCDGDLTEVLTLLLRKASLRQLWLVMLDADSRVAGPLMALANYPRDPLAPAGAPDMPRASHATVLAARMADIVEIVGASRVVLVWERPGDRPIGTEEHAWARELRNECRDRDISVRAQFVLHDGGLRQLTPDDFS